MKPTSLLLVLMMCAATVFAQIPRTISYQGVLTDTAGYPKKDSTYSITFRLYESSSGGGAVWAETKSLTTKRGLFSTQLGDVTPFGSVPNKTGVDLSPLVTLEFDRQYWLGIQIGSDPELSPRMPLSSVPYSISAIKADTAKYSIAGGSPSGTASGDLSGTYPSPTVTKIQNRAIANTIPINGQVLKWDQPATRWTPSDVGGIGGSGVARALCFWNTTTSLAGNSNLFWDDSNLRLGIGTVSPQSSMHVRRGQGYGAIRISPTSDNGEAGIGFFQDGAGTGVSNAWVLAQGGWGNTGKFVIGNENGGAGGNVRLTIEKSGNVGIGTTTPRGILDVIGPTTATSKTAASLFLKTGNATNDGGDFNFNTGVGTTWPAGGGNFNFTAANGSFGGSFNFTAGEGSDFNGGSFNMTAGNSGGGLGGGFTWTAGSGAQNGIFKFQNGSILVSGSTGGTPTSGDGTRMMWIPSKAAFRAGQAVSAGWDDENIGSYSFASNYSTMASGTRSVAMGSQTNATGWGAIAIGTGTSTASGDYSVALGSYVNTNSKAGSFILGDSYGSTTYNSSDNQLMARFTGGYRLYSNGILTTGVYMNGGASGWTNISDRDKKENFRSIDGEHLLSRIRTMPITEWNYRGSDPSIKYIGPVAQDFYSAFHLGGTDSLGINSIAIDGVNMAAIQALEKRTAELRERTDELLEASSALNERTAELAVRTAQLEKATSQLSQLQARVVRLESLLERMNANVMVKLTQETVNRPEAK